MDLKIMYEDANVLVVDKPAGIRKNCHRFGSMIILNCSK